MIPAAHNPVARPMMPPAGVAVLANPAPIGGQAVNLADLSISIKASQELNNVFDRADRKNALAQLVGLAARTDGTGFAAQKEMCRLLRDPESSPQARADLLNTALEIAKQRVDDGRDLSTTVAFLGAHAPDNNGDGHRDALSTHIKKSLPRDLQSQDILDLNRPLTRTELNAAGPPPGLAMSYESIDLGSDDAGVTQANGEAFKRVAEQARNGDNPVAVWVQCGKHALPIVAEMQNGEVHWHLLSIQDLNGQPRPDSKLYQYLNAEWRGKCHQHVQALSESGIEAYQWLESASARLAPQPAVRQPAVDAAALDPGLGQHNIDVQHGNRLGIHAHLLAAAAAQDPANPMVPVDPAVVAHGALVQAASVQAVQAGVNAQLGVDLANRVELLQLAAAQKGPLQGPSRATPPIRKPQLPPRPVTEAALLAAGSNFKNLQVHKRSIAFSIAGEFDAMSFKQELAKVAAEAKNSDKPVVVWVHDDSKPPKHWTPVILKRDPDKNIEYHLLGTEFREQPESQPFLLGLFIDIKQHSNTTKWHGYGHPQFGSKLVDSDKLVGHAALAALDRKLDDLEEHTYAFGLFLSKHSASSRDNYCVPEDLAPTRQQLVNAVPTQQAQLEQAFKQVQTASSSDLEWPAKWDAFRETYNASGLREVQSADNQAAAHPLSKTAVAFEALGGAYAGITAWHRLEGLELALVKAQDPKSFEAALKAITDFDTELRSKIATAKRELDAVQNLEDSLSKSLVRVFTRAPGISEAKRQAAELLKSLESLSELVNSDRFMGSRDFAALANTSEQTRRDAYKLLHEPVPLSASVNRNPREAVIPVARQQSSIPIPKVEFDDSGLRRALNMFAD
jgi:hypothetical protein